MTEFRSRVVGRWTVCLLVATVATSAALRLAAGSPAPPIDALVVVGLVGEIIALIREGMEVERR